MAEALGDCHTVKSIEIKQRGHSVPELVRVYAREVILLCEIPEPLCNAIRVHRLPVFFDEHIAGSMSYYSEKLDQISSDKLQKAAYDTEDSTVVIAGPGSGKTTILTLKIMKLLNGHIKEPQGLACLTFSREAAREFEDRLRRLGYIKRNNVFLGTVHSFCISEILMNFAKLYDCNIPFPIKIVPLKLKKSLYDETRKAMGYPKYKMVEMDKERTLQIVGMSKVKVVPDAVAMKLAKEYEKNLFAMGYIDYESIILISIKLIQEQEYVRKCLSAKYPWIVIDEYQDLGRPLHEMILSLFTKTDIKIFAVGDPDQSIYGFSGAIPDYVGDPDQSIYGFSGAIPDYLMELYNRDDIIPVELKNNYRSNQDIVDGSEMVLNIPKKYHALTRENESADYRFISCKNGLLDQYQYFIENIIPECIENKISLEEIAVLLGKNDDCTELALMCMNEGIPYYISKHKFQRSDFVKWMEECALWVNDKTKSSFDEIYNYWEYLLLMHREIKSEKDKLKEKKSLLNILMNSIELKSNLRLWIEYMMKNLEVESLLKDADQLPDELENLRDLYNEVCDEKYVEYDTAKFSKLGKPMEQITISTRHSSKGLEFEVVVMMGMEEGHFPGWYATKDPKALAEDNRICFVCVSRAKGTCIFMRSTDYLEYNNYYQEMQHKTYSASRYWNLLDSKYGKLK
jgi:DNA helicase II / ATP-dependent DNA helicase PcrA